MPCFSGYNMQSSPKRKPIQAQFNPKWNEKKPLLQKSSNISLGPPATLNHPQSSVILPNPSPIPQSPVLPWAGKARKGLCNIPANDSNQRRRGRRLAFFTAWKVLNCFPYTPERIRSSPFYTILSRSSETFVRPRSSGWSQSLLFSILCVFPRVSTETD